eukprot:scaffold225803_cov38-Prasinocladus_malaysianus.AAC.4
MANILLLMTLRTTFHKVCRGLRSRVQELAVLISKAHYLIMFQLLYQFGDTLEENWVKMTIPSFVLQMP